MKSGIPLAAAILVADQVTKYIMVEKVMRPEGVTDTPFFSPTVIEVLPFFNLRMTWNTGISFSLFNSGEAVTVALLIAVQVMVTGALIWFMSRTPGALIQLASGLIVGGALGNIIDRVRFGAVADFLDFHWADWHFPTFNLADTAISVGVGLWLLDAVLRPSHDAPPKG